jgi:hypothetical protein
VLADGGLAQAKPAPRLAEIAGLRHGEKAFQQYRIEHRRVSVITIHDHSKHYNHGSQSPQHTGYFAASQRAEGRSQ